MMITVPFNGIQAEEILSNDLMYCQLNSYVRLLWNADLGRCIR